MTIPSLQNGLSADRKDNCLQCTDRANVEKADDKDFKPYAVSASISSKPGLRFPHKANVTDMLIAEKWDIVTIQQASGKSAFYDTYEPYDVKFVGVKP